MVKTSADMTTHENAFDAVGMTFHDDNGQTTGLMVPLAQERDSELTLPC